MLLHKLTTGLVFSAMALTPVMMTPSLALADDAKPFVMVDSKGDRGLPAPFVHHKNGPGYLNTSYLFDALVGQDQDGNLVPALAKSWKMSDDGLVIDLTLNKAALWHDGKPVSAKDVVFTFSYMAKHGYAFVSLNGVDKVEALAADQVRISLKSRNASIITGTLISMPILPQHIYANQSDPVHFTTSHATIGSGPYKLVKYDKAQGRYLMQANKGYYGGEPKFDQVAVIKMGPNPAIQAMKKGDVDIIPSLPFNKVDAARKAGLSVLTTQSNHPVRMVYNHQDMFQSKALRQGLAYAIDRQGLVDVAFSGGAGIVANSGYFQKGSPWFSKKQVRSYKFDADKAASLLMGEGWSKNDAGKWMKDSKTIQLRLISEPRYKGLATALSEQLQAFGLNVDLRLLTKGAMAEAAKKRDFDIALFYSGTMGDPSGAKRRVLGKSWSSDGYKPSKAMKAALVAQETASDLETRRTHLYKFQDLYAEELPSYMLINPVWATAYNDRVSPKYMPNGIAIGIPSAMHKSLFLK